MSIMIRLAFKNIKENFKWALMTISGITISLMLITMVITFASGSYNTFSKEILKDEQRWNLKLSGVVDYQGVLDSSDAIESYLVRSKHGEIKLDNVVTYDDEIVEGPINYSILNFKLEPDYFNRDRILTRISNIEEGRAPQGRGEIVLNSYLRTKDDGTYYEIGDTFGFVNLDGIYEEFKVVGLSFAEYAQVSGYDYNHDVQLILEFKEGTQNFKSLTQEIIKLSQGEAEFNNLVNSLSGFTLPTNPLFLTALILSAIIITIISLSSITLIYNAFNLSLEQKIQQIGLIQSIGATKKQISLMVYFEGFLLSTMGITLGIGGGFLLAKLSLLYVATIFHEISDTLVFFTPSISPSVIAIIYVVGFISVYLPIRKSVKRANSYTAIESIRRISVADAKISYNNTPPLFKKIFGMSGDLAYKNRKRDKHKYRSTAISLIITSVLFISIVSFVGYGKQLSAMAANTNFDLMVYERYYPKEESEKVGHEIYDYIVANVNSKDYLRYEEIYFSTVGIPVTQTLESFLGFEYQLNVNVIVFDDLTYKALFPNNAIDDTVLLNYSIGSVYGDGAPIRINHQLSDLKTGDRISGSMNQESYEFTIDHVIMTPPHPHYAFDSYASLSVFISETYSETHFGGDYIDAQDRGSLITTIQSENYKQIDRDIDKIITENAKEWSNHGFYASISNVKQYYILVYSILGSFDVIVRIVTMFIALICISNVLNVLVSTMRQRRSENAVLRSVGLSVKDLRRMLILESIMGSIMPLLIGTVLGIGLSGLMFLLVSRYLPIGQFNIAWEAVFLSWLMILVVTLVNAFVSLKTQGESAIIESIRSNNL